MNRPNLMILAINTSTLQFGLALLKRDGTVPAEYFMSEDRRHFGSLMPALHFLLSTTRSHMKDMEAIIVAIGPGSFTGLRVGLSAAKGLCHALDVPVIGVSSLEALASQVPYSHLPITPVLDSRKGELFTARFVWTEDQELVRKGEDISLRLESFPSMFEGPAIFIGNDFGTQGPLIKKELGPRAIPAPAHCWNLKASALGFQGLKRLDANDFDNPQDLGPVYLRPPDIRPGSKNRRAKSGDQ
ncbi:MAG: tRNA (adenosine(37)-N6)-threonylcarbamoyltransferase complex dimerization subunit type 1 TsaB [Desulfobacterales bacterium]|nr:tRNA (adenosine(37)-N6)-threonylcarbamoyltransferase complex dimerization subunit type 1 TsaB [Desulfobacterales bacterium]